MFLPFLFNIISNKTLIHYKIIIFQNINPFSTKFSRRVEKDIEYKNRVETLHLAHMKRIVDHLNIYLCVDTYGGALGDLWKKSSLNG